MKIINNYDFETSFPPLGHPEHHFTKYPNHPWLKTKSEVEDWLNFYFDDGGGRRLDFVIHNDLTVEIKSVDAILLKDVELFKVQIRSSDDIWVKNKGIKSLIGFPYMANSVYAAENNLSSLEGLENASKIGVLSIMQNELIKLGDVCKNGFVNSIAINVGSVISDGIVNCKNIIIDRGVSKWNGNESYKFLLSLPDDIEIWRDNVADNYDDRLVWGDDNGERFYNSLNVNCIIKEREEYKKANDMKVKLKGLEGINGNKKRKL